MDRRDLLRASLTAPLFLGRRALGGPPETGGHAGELDLLITLLRKLPHARDISPIGKPILRLGQGDRQMRFLGAPPLATSLYIEVDGVELQAERHAEPEPWTPPKRNVLGGPAEVVDLVAALREVAGTDQLYQVVGLGNCPEAVAYLRDLAGRQLVERHFADSMYACCTVRGVRFIAWQSKGDPLPPPPRGDFKLVLR